MSPAKNFERLTLATARLLRADMSERVIRGLCSETTIADLDELDAALAPFEPVNIEPVNMEAVRADLVAEIVEASGFDRDSGLTIVEHMRALRRGFDALGEIDAMLPPALLPEAPLADRIAALIAGKP